MHLHTHPPLFLKSTNTPPIKKTYHILSVILLSSFSLINANEKDLSLSTSTGEIKGILRTSSSPENKTVAIIISGAARSDRDGNQPQTKNNSLKMLAEELVQKNIAVLNFDKRGVGQSQKAGTNEAEITLDTYITDVNEWVNLLKTEEKFEEIVLVGHGEGSLIGIMAAIDNPNVSKLISIAGTSKKAADAAREQFKDQPASIKNIVYKHVEKLEKGEKIPNVPKEWNVLFRSSLQPFLISLYKHDPKEELAKINIPILIIQGDKDIQASVEDGDQLAASNPKAEKAIIENMNYVLKECNKEGQQNQMSFYLRPDFPLNKELVPTIVSFINAK